MMFYKTIEIMKRDRANRDRSYRATICGNVPALCRSINAIGYLLVILLMLPPAVTAQEDRPRERSRPNIVVVLIDDMGWKDPGSYGSPYHETPNIDRLAENGVRFTQAYASSSICSPTRAALLTGKNPARLRITAAIPIQGERRLKGPLPLLAAQYNKNLPLNEVTIAEALGEAGYASASIGKWHVNWNPEKGPTAHGFDVNVAGNRYGSTQTYFFPHKSEWRMTADHPLHRWRLFKEGDGVKGEYLTDRLTDEAIEFIEQNRDQPFFLYLSHYAVHTPLQAKKGLVRKYRKKDGTKHQNNPTYAAMVDSVDRSVGRVMERLKKLDLTKETIVIFTSDNGGAAHSSSRPAHPLRGHKGNFYEGGIRVPLIIRWPGQADAGTTDETPVISTDLYPTILRMAGLKLRPEQHVDGRDLTPLLKGTDDLDRRTLVWHFPNYIGVPMPDAATPCTVLRRGKWKLHHYYEQDRIELYNLEKDPDESANLARKYPDRVRALHKRLVEFRQEANVQMPVPNPEYRRDD